MKKLNTKKNKNWKIRIYYQSLKNIFAWLACGVIILLVFYIGWLNLTGVIFAGQFFNTNKLYKLDISIMPTFKPYQPRKINITMPKQNWPTIGRSIPQYAPECYTVDRSSVVICK